MGLGSRHARATRRVRACLIPPSNSPVCRPLPAPQVLSALSNVYFERVLKSTTLSLWERNVQLAGYSLLIYVPMALHAHPHHMMHGWSAVTVRTPPRLRAPVCVHSQPPANLPRLRSFPHPCVFTPTSAPCPPSPCLPLNPLPCSQGARPAARPRPSRLCLHPLWLSTRRCWWRCWARWAAC
jgi:hypothetical protein